MDSIINHSDGIVEKHFLQLWEAGSQHTLMEIGGGGGLTWGSWPHVYQACRCRHCTQMGSTADRQASKGKTTAVLTSRSGAWWVCFKQRTMNAKRWTENMHRVPKNQGHRRAMPVSGQHDWKPENDGAPSHGMPRKVLLQGQGQSCYRLSRWCLYRQRAGTGSWSELRLKELKYIEISV